jgi:hypothetical protein
MTEKGQLVANRGIHERILSYRGQRVMLDVDLAELYGVTTKRLNEQVKRNANRFPDDFMFQLSKDERDKVLDARSDLRRLRFSRVMPRAFTEHGALMLANVLNSETAVHSSIQIVRTFVRMREAVMQHRDLVRRVDALEKECDRKFDEVFDAIDEMMFPTDSSGRRIGFRGP